MPCTLALGGRNLPCFKTQGGLKTIYFAGFVDGGITSGTASAQTWYEYALKGGSSLETAINGSRENNSVFYTQTVTIQLALLDSVTQIDLEELAESKPHIVVEDYNGQQWLIGAEHGADLLSGTFSTGANLGDFSGFNLTFEAQEVSAPIYLSSAVTGETITVSPAIVAS